MRHILASVYSRDQLHKSAMRLVRIGAIDAATAARAEEILSRQIESDSQIRRWFEGYMRVRPKMSYNVVYHDEPRLLPWVRVVWYEDGSVDAIFCQPTPKSDGFPLKAVKRFLSDSGYNTVRCYVWNLNDGNVTEIG